MQRGENAFLVKYRLKVDKDAVNGENEIDLKYWDGDGSIYKKATFNVSVANPKTDFDVVVQDSTTGSSTTSGTNTTTTTLAIANIGANDASSVIVRIPNQENFRVVGTTSASVIGNLDAGDYTFVSFQIVPTGAVNSTERERNLTVEVSYTDTLGIRRTVQKEVSFLAQSGFRNGATGAFAQTQQTSLSLNGGLLYIVVGVVGIVAVAVLLKFRKRKKK